MRRLFAALLFATISAPVLAESAVEQTFGAWTVRCDAAEYCAASTSAEAGGAAALSVGRHAEEIYWEVAVRPGLAADDEAVFRLDVDGAETVLSGSTEIAAYGAPGQYYLLGGKAQEVLDRLVPGRRAGLRFTSPDGGEVTTAFGLDGLAAALIFIDTRQGRLGSERVAEAPPVGLARVGAPAAVVPADLIARRRVEPDCAALEDLANGGDVVVAPLGEGDGRTTLYIVPCNGGAYNFSSAIYTGGEGSYTRHAFAEFWPSSGWSGTMELFGAGFDAARMAITTAYKSRGLGDCGSAGLYVWTGGSFRLEEFRAKEACDETASEFPVVYRYAPRSGGKPQARPAQ